MRQVVDGLLGVSNACTRGRDRQGLELVKPSTHEKLSIQSASTASTLGWGCSSTEAPSSPRSSSLSQQRLSTDSSGQPPEAPASSAQVDSTQRSAPTLASG